MTGEEQRNFLDTQAKDTEEKGQHATDKKVQVDEVEDVFRKRQVRCKDYHEYRKDNEEGILRERTDKKSRCPGWLKNKKIRQLLLDEALEDPEPKDSKGRPKRVWNAIGGIYFVGVSTNEEELAYNCYPEVPATPLAKKLRERADRSLDEFKQKHDLTEESF